MNTPAKKHGVRYAWREWFQQAKTTPVELIQGLHFEGLPHGMAQTARQAAARYGMQASGYRLKISIGPRDVTIQVIRDAKKTPGKKR